jgi:hypothetical protein
VALGSISGVIAIVCTMGVGDYDETERCILDPLAVAGECVARA